MSEHHYDALSDIFDWEADVKPPMSAPVSRAPSVDVIGELCDAVRRQTNGSVSLSQNDVDKLRHLYDRLHGSKDNGPKSVGAVQEKSVTSSANVVNDNVMGPMVLDTLDGFFMIIDDSAAVEYVTPNVQKYLDIAQDEIINKSVYNLIALPDRQKFVNLFSKQDMPTITSELRHQISFSCQFAHSTQAMCLMHVTAMRSKSADDDPDNLHQCDGNRSCVVCVVRRTDDSDGQMQYQQQSMPRTQSTNGFTNQHQRPQNLNLTPMNQQQMMYQQGPMSAPAMSSMTPQTPFAVHTPQPAGMMMVPAANRTPRFLLTCDAKGNIINVDPRYLSPDMPVTPLIVALQKRNILQICHQNDRANVQQMLQNPSESLAVMSIFLNPSNLLTVTAKTVRVIMDGARVSVFFDCIATKQELTNYPTQMPHSMAMPMMQSNQAVSVQTSSTPVVGYAQQHQQQQFAFPPHNSMTEMMPGKLEGSPEFKPKQVRKRKPAQPKIDPETGEPIPPKRRQKKNPDGAPTKRGKNNQMEQPNPNAAIIDDDHHAMAPSTSNHQQWTPTAPPMMTHNPMMTGHMHSPIMQQGYCMSPIGQPVGSPIRMHANVPQHRQTTPQLIKLLQTAPSAPLEACNALPPVPKRAQKSQNPPLVMNTGVADQLRSKGAATGKAQQPTQRKKDSAESPQCSTPSTPMAPNMFTVTSTDMPSSAPPIGGYQQHAHGQPTMYQQQQYLGHPQQLIHGHYSMQPAHQYRMVAPPQQQWHQYHHVDVSQPQLMVVQPAVPFGQTSMANSMPHDLPDSSSYDPQPVDHDLQPSTFDLGLGGSFDMSHESTRSLVEKFLL